MSLLNKPIGVIVTDIEPSADMETEPIPKDIIESSNTMGSSFNVNVTLADENANPDDPLYSAHSFEELNLPQSILKGLYCMNFRKPSKIQERAIPLLLKNPPANLIGQSQSGTGKTATFVLNILSRIDLSTQAPQALVLAPTRELSRQIIDVIVKMGQFMEGLRVGAAIKDVTRVGPPVGHVLVGTPGTMTDLIRRRQIPVESVKILVLDEADTMIDMQGLGDQCKRVKTLLPPTTQIVLFSATFPDHLIEYASLFAPQANKITLKAEQLTLEGIKQFFFDCNGEEEKYKVLLKFYGLLTVSSSIIFVKRRDTALEIQKRMESDGHKVAQLSGGLEGSERDAVIDQFRSGAAKVLITTNVLARGIDVQSVNMVINYDIPELPNGQPDAETYLHRIGRTGRFGRVGVAISFVQDRKSWLQLRSICDHFKADIEALPTTDWDETEEIVKKVVKSAKAQAGYRPPGYGGEAT